MKLFYLFIMMTLVSGCAYSQRVQSLTDSELCSNLGHYSLYGHSEGTKLTLDEINARNIYNNDCIELANQTADRMAPDYKLELCQNLAAFHYKGNYKKFRNTLTRIESLGFADEECKTMADFYLTRLTRSQEKKQALADAVKELYGRGSQSNPYHIKVQ